MLRFSVFFLTFISLSISSEAKTFQQMFGNVRYDDRRVQSVLESLDFQQGAIALPEVSATLKTTSSFYFLNAQDMKTFYNSIGFWPDVKMGVEVGMFQSASVPPGHPDTIYSTIVYEPGYVSEAVISAIDNDESLKKMASRVSLYSASSSDSTKDAQFVGWGTAPKYDAKSHSLYWSVEAKVEDQGKSRQILFHFGSIFARKGTLYVCLISSKGQSSSAQRTLAKFIKQVTFSEGQSYADYVNGDVISMTGVRGLSSKVTGPEGSQTFSETLSTNGYTRIGSIALVAVASTAVVLLRRQRKISRFSDTWSS